MTTQIQLRRGTAAQWIATNPILAQGELAAELDTGKFKIGNGVNTWSTLVYSSGIQGTPGVNGEVTLATAQTLTNKTITETVFALTGTTPAFTATNGAVQTWALTAASTPTNALTTGQSIILVITPGAFAITWPSVVWTKQGGSGAAPTLFSAGKTSVVLWRVDSVLYGSHLGDTA